ncbi:MAG: hypothetical protein JRI25_26790 [Deltaproteobacteria bacterium]|nr:hypothetical protein [Deltaproteobacteria bacterium]
MHATRLALAVLVATLMGCTSENEIINLVGGDGDLRFNLQFTNEDNVDLDLHVVTPSAEEIYYVDMEDSTGGELDVDCLCFDCPNGPNENIFWAYGIGALSGTYRVSVVYYGQCGFDFPPPSSDYTLRLMEGGVILQTFTGTLSDMDQTDTFNHVYTALE